MVKNRKPMFVSEQALKKLLEMAEERKCFAGDVVDILTGVKTETELNEEYERSVYMARAAGRLPTKKQLQKIYELNRLGQPGPGGGEGRSDVDDQGGVPDLLEEYLREAPGLDEDTDTQRLRAILE